MKILYLGEISRANSSDANAGIGETGPQRGGGEYSENPGEERNGCNANFNGSCIAGQL